MSSRTPAGVAAATWVAAGTDRTRYDGVAMALHWLTAGLVLAQFGLAEVWGFVPRPSRHLMIVAHLSCGILLTVVLIVRIAWRVTPGHQVRGATAGWMALTSKAMHYGLYGLLAAEAVTGFLLRWSSKQPMSFLGLLIPSPFAPFPKPVHRVVGAVHDWIAWTIIVLATGHALAALFRHFVLRDHVLRRMLPGLGPSPANRRR
jgi:cytochrome b561